VFEFLLRGGPVMIPIGLASIIALAVFVERLWFLRTSRVLPRGAQVEILEVSRQGRWSDAITLCRKSDSPMSRVLEVGFLHQGGTRERLKTLMEEVGLREAAELERYSGVVGVVAAIAPLLGLLGTVLGMILTFEVIQEQGLGVVSSLAGGISQALITTFAGLSVGIPALIGHRFLLARVDELVLALEEVALEVLEWVRAEER
jgi:biopolymer transport protein ExbB